MTTPLTNSSTRPTREHMDRGPAKPGPFDDPFVQCMLSCDKVGNEVMQLACRTACLFAKK